PPRALSNIINRQFECNFFEFINSYRIEEAKRLLAAPEYASKNMLEVMYDVGFNSKATFNTLFKKKVGMTPSEYRKSFVAKEYCCCWVSKKMTARPVLTNCWIRYWPIAFSLTRKAK